MGLAYPKPKRVKGRGCRISDRDEAAKEARGYTNPRSFVRLDGSERLSGKDWTRRVHEMLDRSGGFCERVTMLGKAHDAFCYGRGQEPHHIVKRSKWRDDRLSNLANLSHACHLAEDPRKPRWGESR